ncbi:MAG TPA: exonuclease domain-containing protein [Bacteroidia bacterium]|nr:exonuclease domain-containing protein [Bacteroidia bacterium]
MDFITLDFETATAQRDSPCEIGLTFVNDGQIRATKSWLIKPYYKEFDHFNILIHGIKPEHVANNPEFHQLWVEIKPHIENKFLIAHNAGFDISVLRKTLETYKLPFPTLNYFCSYILSKKVWQGLPAYDLKSLCKLNNIDLSFHRAGPDSKATAELTLKAFQIAGISTLDELTVKLNTTIGKLYNGGYTPCETNRVHTTSKAMKIVGDPNKYNSNSIFFERTVVFTGTLSSMVRTEAQRIVADIGGTIGNSVTMETDFLVVGQQDYRVVGEDGMSNKQEKALKLIKKGSTLEILSEEDFLKNL